MESYCSSCLRALRTQSLRRISPSFSKRPRNTATQVFNATRNSPIRASSFTTRQARQYASATAAAPTNPAGPKQAQHRPPDATVQQGTTRPNNSETYEPKPFESTHAQEVTSTLFKECARQADYIIPQAFETKGSIPKTALGEDIGQGSGFWYEHWGFALTPTFNTWAQITFLHMWLLVVRLRYLERERSTMWQQHLVDHFFWEAEHRMSLFHKIDSSSIRQRYLKDLHNQWRGVQAAYDEGLMKGDAVLGAAVWRNVFRAGQGVGGVGVGIGSDASRMDIAVDRGTSGSLGAGQMSKGEETGAASTAQDIVEGDPEKLEGATKEVAQLTQAQEEAAFDWRRVACIVAFLRRGLSRLDKAPDGTVLEGRIRFGDPLREWEGVVGVASRGAQSPLDQADEQAFQQWEKGEAVV